MMNTESKQTENIFSSTTEILSNDIFIEHVKNNIRELTSKRVNRPEPKVGFRYKRDWYDRLSSSGLINSSFFLNNIESIWQKKSHLNSETRNVILYICNKSLQQTIFDITNSKLKAENDSN
jgi:hypothetical protein